MVVRLDAGNVELVGDGGQFGCRPGQFRWRSWSVAVATVGRWLAFCHGDGCCLCGERDLWEGEADIGGIESRLADALMAQSPFAISNVSVRFG
jgi:hypothetical protein